MDCISSDYEESVFNAEKEHGKADYAFSGELSEV